MADLAVGAAILHHILDPARVLASCHRALRPGGLAIFFEPFEAGNVILNLTYQRILARHGCGAGADGIALRRADGRRLQGAQPAAHRPDVRQLDDKWMFTRTYFERIGASRDGPTVDHPAQYRRDAAAQPGGRPPEARCRTAARGAAPLGLGDHRRTDAGMSQDLKREWTTEGAVLLRKAR